MIADTSSGGQAAQNLEPLQRKEVKTAVEQLEREIGDKAPAAASK